jgi:hypothetical protein
MLEPKKAGDDAKSDPSKSKDGGKPVDKDKGDAGKK